MCCSLQESGFRPVGGEKETFGNWAFRNSFPASAEIFCYMYLPTDLKNTIHGKPGQLPLKSVVTFTPSIDSKTNTDNYIPVTPTVLYM